MPPFDGVFGDTRVDPSDVADSLYHESMPDLPPGRVNPGDVADRLLRKGLEASQDRLRKRQEAAQPQPSLADLGTPEGNELTALGTPEAVPGAAPAPSAIAGAEGGSVAGEVPPAPPSLLDRAKQGAIEGAVKGIPVLGPLASIAQTAGKPLIDKAKEAYQQYQNAPPTEKAKPPKEGDSYEFTKGLWTGVYSNPKDLGGAMEAFGHAHDHPDTVASGEKVSKYGAEGMKGQEARVGDIRQIRTDSVGNFMQDLGSYAGWQVGQAAGTSLPAIVGGQVAQRVGQGLGAAVAGPMGAAVGAKGGNLLGAFGPSYIQNLGDTWHEANDDKDIQKLIKDGKVTKAQIGQLAEVVAVPMAALDAYSEFNIIGKKFIGDQARHQLQQNIFKVVAKGAAEGAGTEAITEGLQQVFQEWAVAHLGSNKSAYEQFMSVANASIGGGIGGGALGGGSSALSHLGTPAAAPATASATPGSFGTPGAPGPGPSPGPGPGPGTTGTGPGSGTGTGPGAATGGPQSSQEDINEFVRQANASKPQEPPRDPQAEADRFPMGAKVHVDGQEYTSAGEKSPVSDDVYLRRMGYPDEMIAGMTTADKAREVAEAVKDGVKLDETGKFNRFDYLRDKLDETYQAAADRMKPGTTANFGGRKYTSRSEEERAKAGSQQQSQEPPGAKQSQQEPPKAEAKNETGSENGPETKSETQSQQSEQPSAANKAEDISGGMKDMGKGISQGLHDRLWSRIQDGKTTEQDSSSQQSAMLQAAKLARGRGGLQTREQYEAFAKDYGNLKYNPDSFQSDMKALVDRHSPGTRSKPIKVTSGADITAAEAQVRNPTPAQAAAENHKSGHMEIADLGLTGKHSITIETPLGGTRLGPVDEATGKPAWQVKNFPATYTRIKGTVGADKMALDLFVGSHHVPGNPVYVIDQKDPKTGKFDEHKIFAGFKSPIEARKTYVAAFDDGSGASRIGGMRKLTPDEFKAWIASGDTTAPLTDAMAKTVGKTAGKAPPAGAGTQAPAGTAPNSETAAEQQRTGASAEEPAKSETVPTGNQEKLDAADQGIMDLFSGKEAIHAHDMIEHALTETGTDPKTVDAVDIARAAEIHLSEGYNPYDAWPLAIIRRALEDGSLTPQQVKDFYGQTIAALVEPAKSSERGLRAPALEPATGGTPAKAAQGELPGGGENGPTSAEGTEGGESAKAVEGTEGAAEPVVPAGEAAGGESAGGAAGGATTGHPTTRGQPATAPDHEGQPAGTGEPAAAEHQPAGPAAETAVTPETTAGPTAKEPKGKPGGLASGPASDLDEEVNQFQDAGEKIGGARKDQWSRTGLDVHDIDDMTPAEKAQNITKENVFPRPDYADLVANGGVEAKAAALMKIIYDRIAVRPDADSQKDFITALRAVRDVMATRKTADQFDDLVSLVRTELGTEGGAWVLRAIYQSRSTKNPLYTDRVDERRAEHMVTQGFPDIQPWQRKFEVSGTQIYDQQTQKWTDRTEWSVLRLNGIKGHRYFIQRGFKTREEAVARAVAEYESLTGEGGTEKQPTEHPHLDVIARTGPDYRAGKDIATTEEVMDAFGYRAVEWGKWATQAERQKFANLAYDALHDLAATLGISPKALSLNGTLAIGFGSRGKGGKGAGAAHYEPGRLVINMTKENGAGSLAHEWWHALDHYLGESYAGKPYGGAPIEISGGNDRPKNLEMRRKATLRTLPPPLARAAQELYDAIHFVTESPEAHQARLEEIRKETERAGGWVEGLARREAELNNPQAKHGQIRKEIEKAKYQIGLWRASGERKLAAAAKPKQVDSPYFTEAKTLGGKSGEKGYYSRPNELHARAFESWVFDQIAAAGHKSQYLVQGVEPDRQTVEKGFIGNPYPAGEQRARINAAFEKFFQAIEATTGKHGEGTKLVGMTKEAWTTPKITEQWQTPKVTELWQSPTLTPITDAEKLKQLAGEMAELAAEISSIEAGTTPPAGHNPEVLADRFAAHLRTQSFPTIIAARQFAKAAGFDLDSKVIDETIELGVIKAARAIIDDGRISGGAAEGAGATMQDAAIFKALVDLYGRQPKLGVRTSTSMREQAYSTPVPLAFVASRLAGVTQATSVYEPTAGNGALLIEANPDHARVNEINQDRRKNLQAQGFQAVMGLDASEDQPAITQARNPVDVVLANPPFGAVREEGESKLFNLNRIQQGYQTHEIDHVISLYALGKMKDDGRAVLILGGINKLADTDKARGEAYNGKAKREFYKVLYDRYNVTDHFTVAGELYERQGAGWPVDVIVIDGRGKSERGYPAKAVPQVLSTWDEVGGKLNGRYPVNGLAAGVAHDGPAAGAAEGGPASGNGRGGPAAGGSGHGHVAQPGEPVGVRPEPVSGVEPGGPAAGEGRGAEANGPDASGEPDRFATQSPAERLASDVDIDDAVDEALGLKPKAKPAGTIEDRIIAAAREVMQSTGRVLLKDLRPKIADVKDADLDTVLKQMQIAGRLSLMGLDNARERMMADHKAALNIGGNPRHLLYLINQGGEIEQPARAQPRKNTARAEPAAGYEPSASDRAIMDLFGSDEPLMGETSAEPPFDNAKYEKAKPYFKDAAQRHKELWGDAVALIKAIIDHFRDVMKMTEKGLQQLAQYLKQFAKDVRSGKINLAEDAAAPKAETTPEPPKAAEKRKEKETELQVAYVPQSKRTDSMGVLVPVNMKDAISEALAKLEAKVGNIDEFVAKELGYEHIEAQPYESGKIGLRDAFASEQVDALGLAIDNIKQRKALVLGDQTGIGKGRVNAGIMRWAMKNGHVPIFVTEKPNLYGDMYRDLRDIGIKDYLGREPRLIMTNAGENIALDEDGEVRLKSPTSKQHNETLGKLQAADFTDKHDILFTTYDQMNVLKPTEDTPRRELLRRLAPNAVFIFDESHNGGAAEKGSRAPKMDKQGRPYQPQRSKFIRSLLLSKDADGKAYTIPQGVLYSSATYAKRADSMDLYAVTNMWMAVDDISDLADAILRGGVPMQQVVAGALATDGQYIRRERSFYGINYNTPVVPVDNVRYGNISHAMMSIQDFSLLIPDIRDTIGGELAGGGDTIGGDASTGGGGADSINFTAIMHNIVNQMLLSMKADQAVEHAIAAIKRGQKPVLTVANTMGAFMDDYASDMGIKPGDPFKGDFRDILNRYLDRTRTLTIKKSFDEDPIYHYLSDEELGLDGVSRFAHAKQVIADLDLGDLPISPIDHIKNKMEKAGYRVGEITGRGLTLDYSYTPEGSNSGDPILRRRPGTDTSINGRRKTISGFNTRPEKGGLHAVIINRAGATGISMHASSTFDDQSQRHMFLVQPEADIATHMQMLGRIHRTGQVVVPEYTQLIADIPAEKRPASVLQKKMGSLNANTTANRGSALTAKEVPDFMNEYGDQVAAQWASENFDLNHRLDFPVKINHDTGKPKVEDAMRKLTGRIPLLPPKQQEQIYEELESEYKAKIEQADAMGENALEAKTFKLDAKTLETTQVQGQKNDSGSMFAAPVNAELASVKKIGKPYTAQQVVEKIVANAKLANPENVRVEEIKSPYAGMRATVQYGIFGDINGQRVQLAMDRFYYKDQADKRAEQVRNSAGYGDLSNREVAAALIQQLESDHSMYGRMVAEAKQAKQLEVSDLFQTWKKEGLDGIADEAKAEKERLRLNEIETRWTETYGMLDIGRRYTLKTNGGNYVGFLTDIFRDGKALNPMSLGAWKAEFAIPDSARSVALPFSRLFATNKMPEDSFDAIGVEQRGWTETPEATLAEFDRQQKELREDRYILTGNLLSAFDWSDRQGRIINYTDSKGATRQGILMPRGYDLGKQAIKKGKLIQDPNELVAWLKANKGKLAKTREDEVSLGSDYYGNRFFIATDRAKKTAGVYFLDEPLTKITGDFKSANKRMSVEIDERQLLPAIRRLQELGAQFYVPTVAPKATKVEDETPPDEPPPTGGQPEPESEEGEPEMGATQADVWDDPARLNKVVARLKFNDKGQDADMARDEVDTAASTLAELERDIAALTPEDYASLKPGEVFTATEEIEDERAALEGKVNDLRNHIVDLANKAGTVLGLPKIEPGTPDMPDNVSSALPQQIVTALEKHDFNDITSDIDIANDEVEVAHDDDDVDEDGMQDALDTLRGHISKLRASAETAIGEIDKAITGPPMGETQTPRQKLAHLTPKAQEKKAELERAIKLLVQHLTGKTDVAFAATLPAAKEGYPDTAADTSGGYYRPAKDIIQIAMADPTYNRPDRIAVHEAFHRAENFLMSDADMAILKREEDRLRPIAAREGGYESGEGLADYEVRAWAAQAFYRDQDQGGFGNGLHVAVRRIFDRIRRALRQLRNYFEGLGFRTTEDIFQDFLKGKMAANQRRKQGRFTEREDIMGEHAKAPLADEPALGATRAYTPEEEAVLERVVEGGKPSILPKTLAEVYTRTKDDLYPIEVAEKAMAAHLPYTGAQAQLLPAPMSPYKLARLTRGAAGMAEHWLTIGTFDFHTRAINGPSLQQVLKPVENDLRGFVAYAISARAIEKEAQGVRTGVPIGDAQQVVSKGYARYEPVMRALVDFQDRGIDYLVAAGLISVEGQRAMKALNKDYIPYYRFMGEDTELGHGVGGGIKTRNPVMRMKGGMQQIIDPIESIVKNVHTFLSLAERNRALRAFEDLANSSTIGSEYMQSVIQKRRPIEVTADEINRHLRGEGLTDQVSDGMTIFRPMPFRPEPDQIAIYTAGKRKIYRVGRDLAEAVNAMDREQLNLLTRILAFPAKVLRAGAVLAPEFIARNPVRDQFSAAAFSQKGYLPIYDFVKGLGHVLTKDEAFQSWLKHGGAGATMVSIDRNYISRNVVKMNNPSFMNKTWNIAKSPIDLLRAASEIMENATRVGDHAKSLQSRTHPSQAAFDSREVTLDFARIGSQMKTVNAVIPFFNAQVEGVDRARRGFRDNAFKTLFIVAATITLPSILLWFGNKDDPRYKELPQWEKDFYWHIMTDNWVNITDKQAAKVPAAYKRNEGGQWMQNMGTPWRIPKPFELGVLFGSVPERALEAFFTDNPHAFKNLGDSVLKALLPNFIPQLMVPFIEQFANKSIFTDRALVPKYLESLKPKYQATQFTSGTAQVIGNLISKVTDSSFSSPIVVDNYIREWTGGLGTHITSLIDKGLDAAGVTKEHVSPERTWADLPVIKGFASRWPTMSAQSVQDFYETYDQRKKAVASVKFLAKAGDKEGAKVERETTSLEIAEGIHKALGNTTKAIRGVYSDMKMTPFEKRQLIDSMILQSIEMAKRGNAIFKNTEKKAPKPELVE